MQATPNTKIMICHIDTASMHWKIRQKGVTPLDFRECFLREDSSLIASLAQHYNIIPTTFSRRHYNYAMYRLPCYKDLAPPPRHIIAHFLFLFCGVELEKPEEVYDMQLVFEYHYPCTHARPAHTKKHVLLSVIRG